jgi:cytochrome bd-type quinol oxidase subunit 1
MSSGATNGSRETDGQRGLVVGRRFAGAFFAAPACAAPLAFACARAGAVTAFFLAAGFLPVVALAPDETRDECFARWRVFFGAAASAIDVVSANAAISAITSIFIVLPAIRSFLRGEVNWNRLRLR